MASLRGPGRLILCAIALVLSGPVHSQDDPPDHPAVLTTAGDLQSYSGVIDSLTAGELRFLTDEGAEKMLPIREIYNLIFTGGESSGHDAGLGEAWQLELDCGDRLRGNLLVWGADGVAFEVTYRGDVELKLTVPRDRIRALWRGEEARREVEAKKQDAPNAADRVHVRRDDRLQSVLAQVLGVKDDALSVRYREEERTIALERLAGIELGREPGPPPRPSLQHRLRLRSGDTLTGHWVGYEAAPPLVQIETPWQERVTVPIDAITRIETLNGRLVFLSDWPVAEVEEVPFFDRILPHRLDRSLTGGPLILADGPHDRGIAVHARTVLHYEIDREFQRFAATVGFQIPEGQKGRASFRVLGDGAVLVEEKDLRGTGQLVIVDVLIEDVQRLTLEVDYGENQDIADRVVWADARLLRARTQPKGSDG